VARGLFLTVLLLSVSCPAFAECKGIWDVHSLAEARKPHVLLSDKNVGYQLSPEFLTNLSETKKRIDKASGIFTRFLLCNSDEPNAYVLREGAQSLTAVTLGMTRVLGTDYDAYAAIMGHENAHITQNHIAQKKTSSVGFGILQVLAGIALEVAIQGSGGASGIGSDIASIGTQAFSASYSRSHEYEADRIGLQYAVAAGFSPDGAIRLHEKMNTSRGFLSTHPSSGERTAELRKLMQEMGMREMATNNAKIETAINVPAVRQEQAFGMVVSSRHRLGYYIGTQTGPEEPRPNMRVWVTFENGERLEGTIRKVNNGFFSVTTDQKFTSSIEGGAIALSQ